MQLAVAMQAQPDEIRGDLPDQRPAPVRVGDDESHVVFGCGADGARG